MDIKRYFISNPYEVCMLAKLMFNNRTAIPSIGSLGSAFLMINSDTRGFEKFSRQRFMK